MCACEPTPQQLFSDVLLYAHYTHINARFPIFTVVCAFFYVTELTRTRMHVSTAAPPSPPHPVVSGCVTAPLTGSSNALSDLCEIAGLLSAAEDSLETNCLLIPSARGEREGGPWDSYQSTIHHTDRPPQQHPGSWPPPGLAQPAASALGSHVPLWWMEMEGGWREGGSEIGMLEMPVHLFYLHFYLSRLMALLAVGVSAYVCVAHLVDCCMG